MRRSRLRRALTECRGARLRRDAPISPCRLNRSRPSWAGLRVIRFSRRRSRRRLYYRLRAGVIRLPPLRERREDIGLLAEHFIDRFNGRGLRRPPVAGFDDGAMAALRAYSWPGNVRELSNAIEGAFSFGRSATIGLSDLPAGVVNGDRPIASARAVSPQGLSFAEVECDLIRRALEATNGNRSRAAKLLKISRKRLYAKMAKYELSETSI
jgi:transcriptional regulator with PAS, ATPase and Fis domain